MTTVTDRVIVIIGADDPSDALLARAAQFDEVFVVARAVPDPAHRWVVDDDRSEAAGRARLGRAVARLRVRGVRVSGVLGDAAAAAARGDARALFPRAEILG